MVLAIAAEINWEARQLDVKTDFLFADIEEEVFVAEPPGFETNDNEKGLLVRKLRKILYGLAQIPRKWFHTMYPVPISIGIFPRKSDTRYMHLHLQPRRGHHHPHVLRGRSSCDWRRCEIDRAKSEAS